MFVLNCYASSRTSIIVRKLNVVNFGWFKFQRLYLKLTILNNLNIVFVFLYIERCHMRTVSTIIISSGEVNVIPTPSAVD